MFDETAPNLTVAKATEDSRMSDNQGWVENLKKDIVVVTSNVISHFYPSCRSINSLD
jgi:hypothetical protein